MPIDEVLRSFGLIRIILTISFVYVILRAIYNVYFHPLSKIPGPLSWSASRLPYISSLLRGTIVHDIQKLHQQYSPILRIAPNEVTFARADAWTDIFQSRSGQFLKDPVWWKGRLGAPASLISAIEPETHARFRKALAPAFTTRSLKAQEPILHRYVNPLGERLAEEASKQGGEVDIGPWFNFFTFDIFGDLGYGVIGCRFPCHWFALTDERLAGRVGKLPPAFRQHDLARKVFPLFPVYIARIPRFLRCNSRCDIRRAPHHFVCDDEHCELSKAFDRLE
ncbi:cytochrome P450 [Xylariaceae sp. FL0255]|nr:cytochrome P450 [Xylariaceae sp. FL0255]